MQPIVAHRVSWSVDLSACLSQ